MSTKRGHAALGGIASTDSYLPAHGNGGYRVTHYDLELDYRPGPGRLAGRAVISAVAGPLLAEISSVQIGRASCRERV